MDDGIRNGAWDAYDKVIHDEIGDLLCSLEEKYNARFIEDAFRTGYLGVDWKLAKAMVWVGGIT
ncbi:MAG: hypothetical protein WC474_11880 [Hydrogenophilaceae bacterium]